MKIKLPRNFRLEISNQALRHPIDALRNRLNEPAVQLTRRNRNDQAAPPRTSATLPPIPVASIGAFESEVQGALEYEQLLARSEQAARENTRANEVQRMLKTLPTVETMPVPTSLGERKPQLPPLQRPVPPMLPPAEHGPGFFDGTFTVPGVTTNGVQTLNAQQLAAAAKRLQTIMAAKWLRPSETVGANMSQADWNAKIRDTDRALNRLASGLPDHKVALGCVFDGEPIGLAMCEPLEDQDELWIDYVVAHPLQAGAGSALIEAAVNLSSEKGFGGQVSLEPWDGSKQAFLAMGFEDTPWKFVLDPRSSANRSKWLREDRQWKLRAYLEKPLLPGMAGLSTRPNRDEGSVG